MTYPWLSLAKSMRQAIVDALSKGRNESGAQDCATSRWSGCNPPLFGYDRDQRQDHAVAGDFARFVEDRQPVVAVEGVLGKAHTKTALGCRPPTSRQRLRQCGLLQHPEARGHHRHAYHDAQY